MFWDYLTVEKTSLGVNKNAIVIKFRKCECV